MHRIGMLSIVALLSVVAAWNYEVDFGNPTDAPKEFSYEGDTGPVFWSSLDPASYSLCGNGTRQSPINLPSTKNGTFENLTLFWTDLASPVSIANNGHTVQVDVANNTQGPNNYATYNGETYQFVQFHFHSLVFH
jgi:carbonic anhydrase